jgi:hypothetical protein
MSTAAVADPYSLAQLMAPEEEGEQPPPPPLWSSSSPRRRRPSCPECEAAAAAMRQPAFHWCVRDAVVTAGFRSHVGPIERPASALPLLEPAAAVEASRAAARLLYSRRPDPVATVAVRRPPSLPSSPRQDPSPPPPSPLLPSSILHAPGLLCSLFWCALLSSSRTQRPRRLVPLARVGRGGGAPQRGHRRQIRRIRRQPPSPTQPRRLLLASLSGTRHRSTGGCAPLSRPPALGGTPRHSPLCPSLSAGQAPGAGRQ